MSLNASCLGASSNSPSFLLLQKLQKLRQWHNEQYNRVHASDNPSVPTCEDNSGNLSISDSSASVVADTHTHNVPCSNMMAVVPDVSEDEVQLCSEQKSFDAEIEEQLCADSSTGTDKSEQNPVKNEIQSKSRNQSSNNQRKFPYLKKNGGLKNDRIKAFNKLTFKSRRKNPCKPGVNKLELLPKSALTPLAIPVEKSSTEFVLLQSTKNFPESFPTERSASAKINDVSEPVATPTNGSLTQAFAENSGLLEKKERKEIEELAAFEQLEELANDSSFASNASTVVSLLQKGLPSPLPHAKVATGSKLRQVAVKGKDISPPKNSMFSSNAMSYKVVPRGISLEDEFDMHKEISDGATSTPNCPDDQDIRKCRVHFQSQGAEVLEYPVSDADDDTLSDSTSVLDNSEIFIDNTDLENLGINAEAYPSSVQSNKDSLEICTSMGAGKVGSRGALQPLRLEFSPPPQKPQESASHLIWSIFTKGRNTTKNLRKQPDKGALEVKCTNDADPPRMDKVSGQVDLCAAESSSVQSPVDFRAHKLVLSRLHELEEEITKFKDENMKLENLKLHLEKDREDFILERSNFCSYMETEKKKLEDYLIAERNKLWKDKQDMIKSCMARSSETDMSQEVSVLNEKLMALETELKRKQSLYQFSSRKASERIKALETENNALKDKINKLQSINKENLRLRHLIDRNKIDHSVKSKHNAKYVDNIQRCNAPLVINSQKVQEPQPDDKDGYLVDYENFVNDKKRGRQKKVVAFQNCENEAVNEAILVPSSVQEPTPTLCSEEPLSMSDNGKTVVCDMGNRQEIDSEGNVFFFYYNGDKKEVYKDKTVYIYASDDTKHTTFNDGREIIEFSNGQKEVTFSDGSSEVIFPNGSIRRVSSSGSETLTSQNGTVTCVEPDGTKVFKFADGQVEVHTPDEKRREYPDGTVKILHNDGRLETRYKSGRVRIKDKDGNIIRDSLLKDSFSQS